MMIKLVVLSVGLFAAGYSSAATQSEFYVAPSGSDSNQGTRTHPFQSFQKAKEAVAQAIPSMRQDITVTFAGGTYPVRETIQFGPKDSPTGHFTVTYKAAEGQTPLFTGGAPVSGWKKHDDHCGRPV